MELYTYYEVWDYKEGEYENHRTRLVDTYETLEEAKTVAKQREYREWNTVECVRNNSTGIIYELGPQVRPKHVEKQLRFEQAKKEIQKVLTKYPDIDKKDVNLLL